MGSVLCQAVCSLFLLGAPHPAIHGYQDPSGNWRTQFAPGAEVHIIGEGFGHRKGRVSLGYVPWKVQKWAAKRIIIRAPEHPSVHSIPVTVWTRSNDYYQSMGFSVTAPKSGLRKYREWVLDRWNHLNPERAISSETIEEAQRSLGALSMCRDAEFPEWSLTGLKCDFYDHAAKIPDELQAALWNDLNDEEEGLE